MTVKLFDEVVTLEVNKDIKPWKGECCVEIENIDDNPILDGSYVRFFTKDELIEMIRKIESVIAEMD